MINIYESNETNFNNFGLAVLHPLNATESSKVNGLYSLTLSVPLEQSEDVTEDRIVKADGNLYRILRISRNGVDKEIIDIYCESIFQCDMIDDYSASFIYSNKSVEYVLGELLSGTIYTVGPCDDLGLNSIVVTQKNKTEILKDILNIWQGELQINGLEISIKSNIGNNSGVRIKKGKNLKSINEITDISNVVTRLHYANKEQTLGGTVDSPFISVYDNIKNIYMEFDENTQVDLDNVALQWLISNDKPYYSLDVNFADLYFTEEYEQYKELEKINLGDIVTIQHDKLGIDIQARILQKEEDIIQHRNTRVVLANYRENYFDYQTALEKTKTTVDYAFRDRMLNSATLKGINIIDTTRNVTSFAVSENGEISINGDVTLSPTSVISWGQVTGANKPDDNANYVSDGHITTITNDTIETTNVIAQNLQVQSANILGTLTADKLISNDNAIIGNKLIIDGTNFGAGIDWDNGKNEIYIDPVTKLMSVNGYDIEFVTDSGNFRASDIGSGPVYSEGYGIDISVGEEISVDTTQIATRTYVRDYAVKDLNDQNIQMQYFSDHIEIRVGTGAWKIIYFD